MTFLIGGANSLTGGYEIDNSLRFNDDDNPSLSRANDSGGSNTAGTLSFWTKRSEINTGYLFFARSDDSNVFNVYFSGSERLEIRSSQGGSVDFQYKTNALFRDPSAWYHIVIAIDTTDGTAADRCKLFVNGSRITSFNTQTNFGDSDTIELFQSDATVYVTGEHEGGTIANPYDGYIADLNFVDGTQYDASNFGETNDNGVWIPKEFEGTQGTNGFRLEFKQTGTSANASGMGADTSGNTNHLTPSNLTATDVTTDTPTNNFATMNPLDVGSDLRDNGSFAEGNLEVTNGATSGQADQQRVRGTIAVTKGKWYFEMKQIANSASIGVLATEAAHGGTSANSMLVEYNDGGEIRFFNGSGRTTKTTGIDSFDDDDIVGCALDMDNKRAYFHKNGTYQGDPTPDPAGSPSGAGQFGGIQTGFTMAPCMFDNSSGSAGKGSFNFGNAPFAISSGNADANGFGNFEFAVPSGYFALCTKNLAQFG